MTKQFTLALRPDGLLRLCSQDGLASRPNKSAPDRAGAFLEFASNGEAEKA
jgi:hypothetical protein